MEALEYGILRAARPKHPLAMRLRALFEAIEALLGRVSPDVVAVEGIFSHLNFQSALRLAHARGVVLLAAARAGVEIREYAPRHVKMATAGNGSAEKAQVQAMVRRLLGLPPEEKIPYDASDALAVALCEANGWPLREALSGAREAGRA